MLPTSTTKACQNMIARIMSLGLRQRPNGPAHSLVRNLDKSVGNLVHAHLLSRVDLALERYK